MDETYERGAAHTNAAFLYLVLFYYSLVVGGLASCAVNHLEKFDLQYTRTMDLQNMFNPASATLRDTTSEWMSERIFLS